MKTSKVNFRKYIIDKKAPAETISEMSPVQVHLRGKAGESTLRQRVTLRKLASKLRLGHKV
jgi:hypothetical protein